jgi:hypothetical protein
MKVGDNVICIQTCSNGFNESVFKGKIYTIYAIRNCPGCKKIQFDVGLRGVIGSDKCLCGYGSGKTDITWAVSTLFAPIQYDSAHDELLEKIVEEKPDVLIPVAN